MNHFLNEYLWQPIWEKSKGEKVSAYTAFLKEASLWSRDELNRFRNQRLQHLIQHAYQRVPYYREIMRAKGLSPDDICTVEDLHKLPVLARADLQQAKDQLIAKGTDIRKCIKGASSGSTGEPVVFYHDKSTETAGKAARRFCWMMGGWRSGDANVTVWGNPHTVQKDWSRISSRAKARLMREHRIPAFRLSDRRFLDDALDRIYQYPPDFIDGYTNSIFVLAARAQERELGTLGSKGVFTTAEQLLVHQRNCIEEMFGPVYDQYGSSEINGVAFQCKERCGYHILEPHVVVEFEDLGMGNTKALVITDLDNYTMPFIRYRIGDLAVVGENNACSCGLPFAKFVEVVGRKIDLIQTPQGGYLLVPSFLGGKIFKEVKGVRQHQVVLKKDGVIEVRLAMDGALTSENRERITTYLESYLGDDMPFCVKVVSEIPVSPNGKYKLLVKE